MKRSLIIFSILAGSVILFIIFFVEFDNFHRKENLVSMLNIEASPHSLKVIDFKSPFTTDILKTCLVKINPKEFQFLLAGYKFKHKMIAENTSYTVVGPNVGKKFKVAEEFSVEPDEFSSGGYIKIFPNKQHNRAIIDIYIE